MLPKKTITALSKDKVKQKKIVRRLQYIFLALRQKFPRRPLPGVMYIMIADYLERGGIILNDDKTPYELPDDQVLFGDDVEFRWVDNSFLAVDENGEFLYTNFRNLDLLILIDLFIQIIFLLSLPDNQ